MVMSIQFAIIYTLIGKREHKYFININITLILVQCTFIKQQKYICIYTTTQLKRIINHVMQIFVNEIIIRYAGVLPIK